MKHLFTVALVFVALCGCGVVAQRLSLALSGVYDSPLVDGAL
jgi:hypothetical protein